MGKEKQKRRLSPGARNNLTAYSFLLPNFVGFAVFTLVPMVFSLALSFIKWNGVGLPAFTGIDNFARLLRDEAFVRALANTVLYYSQLKVTEFFACGSGCAFTVITLSDKGAQNELFIEKLEVRSAFKNTVFADDEIEALSIRSGQKHFTLAIAHREYATPTDTFIADGCSGFGSAVVFDRNAGETEIGTVLNR